MKKLLLSAVCAMMAVASMSAVQRMMVCEEGTGTWCGWCPRGIVGLETMKANHPDGFIGIAAHNGDPMEITAYAALPLSGYPGCLINRGSSSSYTKDPDPTELEKCYTKYFEGSVADAEMTLTAEWATVEKSAISVKVTSKFVNSTSNGKYSIALVLLENNVGPYKQSNYYSGGSKGEMGGWEDYPSSKEWYFDDVARYLSNYNGDPGSVPAEITAGEEYVYESAIPVFGLKNASSTPITVKPQDVEVVAMLLCSSPRSIIQAVKIDASEIAECSTGMHWQEISFDQQFEEYYEPGTDVVLEAAASSGLPVSYTIASGADIATIEGNVLSLNATGEVVVTAVQDGNDSYFAANPVSVKIACKKQQAITWDQDLSGVTLNEPFPLEATASSELPCSFKLSKYSSAAKVKNGAITFTKPATVTVVASQGGDSDWAPAANVEREITCEESGIENVSVDDLQGALVFDLNGVHVTVPEAGQVYVIVKGMKASKVFVK